MGKLFCVVSCPIDTYSGYGARARDLVKALIKVKGEEWDVRIISQRWGNTPWGYLKNHNETDLINRIIPHLPKQPDIWFQITVPNEFQSVGKYNVGVTALIETTICDPSWVEGMNRMNLNLVSSVHSKNIAINSKFEKRDANQQVVGTVELTKPVEVLFEGVQLEGTLNSEQLPVNLELNNISEKFCFLYVGHWLQGVLGEDRKNTGMMIKVFLETFKNKKDQPALILKTSGVGSSIMDRDQIEKKIDEIRKTVKGILPNIYLLHGELSENEMFQLYAHPKVKAMVNLTKGEGYGRPLIEFTQAQKPIVVSGWSGHTDFLSKDFSVFVGGEIKPIDKSAVVENMLIAESKWFTPDYNQASLALKVVYADYDEFVEKAKRQSYICRNDFSLEKMGEKLVEILDANFTKEIPLPKLSKTTLPTLNKAENDK